MIFIPQAKLICKYMGYTSPLSHTMDIKVIYSLFNIKNKYYERKQFPIVKLIKLDIIHKEPKLASPYTTLPKSYITVKAKLLYNNCIFFIKCIINIPSFEYTLECFSNILFSLLF